MVRLLRSIFEVDPLPCAACGLEPMIVSVITEPNIIDAILPDTSDTPSYGQPGLGARGTPCESNP